MEKNQKRGFLTFGLLTLANLIVISLLYFVFNNKSLAKIIAGLFPIELIWVGVKLAKSTKSISEPIMTNLSIKDVFETSKGVAEKLGMKLLKEDANAGQIVFMRGTTSYSLGENLIVSVSRQGNNNIVSVSGSIASWGALAEYQKSKDVKAMYQEFSKYKIG